MMKEKLKKLFGGFDAAVGCYVIAGMLLMIGVLEVLTGLYFWAFNSFLYTIVIFCTMKQTRMNRRLLRLIVLKHLLIEALEEKAGIKKDNEETNTPEPPTSVEAQGEKKVED